MNNRRRQPEKKNVPFWFPIAGMGAAFITLIFFMAIVWQGKVIACDQKFFVIVVMSFGLAMSASFLGGWASAKGYLPFVPEKHSSMKISATGGIAVFIIAFILGHFYYKCTQPLKPLPRGTIIVYDGMSRFGESGFSFASRSIVAWDSAQADILVSNQFPLSNSEYTSSPAKFFIQHDMPPYPDGPADRRAQGGIVRMQQTRLEDVIDCPDQGYQYHWVDAIEGCIYCLKLRDGNSYAKIKVNKVLNNRIELDWVYQPNRTTAFW